MKRIAFRVVESDASVYTEDSLFTPVVPSIRQAMLIHAITMRMSRPARANPGACDAHCGLNERSFDAEPDWEDEDVVLQLRGNGLFTTSTGEPDVLHSMAKEVYFDPPIVYTKPKIYAYSRSISSITTQNSEIDIFYTVESLTKDEWIAAISEGL